MKKPEHVKTIKAHARRGHKKGGFSQRRFERLAEEQTHEYLKKITEEVEAYFDQFPDIEGILVGGPGQIKDVFINKYLSKKYKDKVIYVTDTGNEGELGLRDLLQNAARDNVMEEQEYIKEKKAVDGFLERLGKNDPLVEYGIDEVKESLVSGRVATVLVSLSADDGLITEAAELASGSGAEVKLISTETEEGSVFSSFKIAAILRWAPE